MSADKRDTIVLAVVAATVLTLAVAPTLAVAVMDGVWWLLGAIVQGFIAVPAAIGRALS